MVILLNKYTTLALTILIAILFNSVIFHGLYEVKNTPGALVELVLGLVLVYVNKDRFSELLCP
ncbi:MAG: hypothetical protein ACJA1A_002662 [Saprospiraceae bacterium]|jgi:hypothetical protein